MAPALADQIYVCGRKLPRYAWFMLSGAICDVFQFFLNGIVATMVAGLEYERDTVAWTISYTLCIALRQETHRIFVFGAYEGTYWENLSRVYMTYATTICASIVLRSMLAHVAEGLPSAITELVEARTIAYFGTVLCTGCFSYFALKRGWKKGGGSTAPKSPLPK
mmetsp:Transcript_7960/g.14462  ORF Transcript_7960/g.14462 Transcript_7960/m.14462 type:complete len:165 (-) Transcript_7960:90-584(-)